MAWVISTIGFLLVIGIATGLPSLPQDLSVRIVGGVQVSKNELPYQISLQVNGNHYCGGAILSPNYVVTAAHCVVNDLPSSLRVVAGEHTIGSTSDDGTEQVRTVSSVKVHPSYSGESLQNDIAVLKLSSALSLNSAVGVISLPAAGFTASGLALVSGWGRTTSGGEMASILRKVSVPIITDTKCRQSYGGSIIDTMLCAGYDLGGKDSCQGDSGGPLVAGTGSTRYLAGVVSWGYECALPAYPGVYTEVSKFITFLNDNTDVLV